MHFENSQAKSALFRAFVQESILKDGSFFFETSDTWSKETIDSFLQEFNIKGKDKTFWGKLQEQLAKLHSPKFYELMFDALYVFYLFPSDFTDEGKIRSVQEISQYWKDDLQLNDEEIRKLVRLSRLQEFDTHATLTGSIGSCGGISQRYWHELRWMLGIISKMKSQRTHASQGSADSIDSFENLILHHEESSPQLRHIFLYLIDPTRYERISSTGNKRQIVRALAHEYLSDKATWEDEVTQPSKIDKLILSIRQSIVQKKKARDGAYDTTHFDFYEDLEIGNKWKGGYVASGYDILKKYNKQIILYGAPGTGKTYNARRLVEDFLDRSSGETLGSTRYSDDNSHFKSVVWDLVQFNQAYSYEDFVEGFFPNPEKGGRLEIRPGIFRKICRAALDFPEKTFLLIIDEINRGNIPKILGELLYALEYRNESVRLHYSREELVVPENLYLIGTMNTADKSIALLDVALRRRFWFVKCEPQKSVIEERFMALTGESKQVGELAIKLFSWLNGGEPGKGRGKIEEILGENSDVDGIKIGHSYFLKLTVENEQPSFEDLKSIWFYSVLPLLEEYCNFNRELVDQMLTYGKDINLTRPNNFTLDNLTKLPTQ